MRLKEIENWRGGLKKEVAEVSQIEHCDFTSTRHSVTPQPVFGSMLRSRHVMASILSLVVEKN